MYRLRHVVSCKNPLYIAAVRLLNRAEYYTFVAKTPQLLAVKGFLHQTWEHFILQTTGRNVPRQDKLMLKISTYKQFIFRSSEQGRVEVRQFIDSMLSSTFTLKKWTQPPEMPMDKAYPQGKVSNNANKVKDIRKLCEYTHGYEDFYDSILQWPTTNAPLAQKTLDADN